MHQSALPDDPNREATDTMERRREPRYPTSSAGEVQNLSSISPSHPAEVVDVSRSGMCIRSDLELPRGVRVKVLFGDSMAFGEVRWCRRVEDDWFETGVAVEHIVRRDLVSRIRSAADPASGDEEPEPPDDGK